MKTPVWIEPMMRWASSPRMPHAGGVRVESDPPRARSDDEGHHRRRMKRAARFVMTTIAMAAGMMTSALAFGRLANSADDGARCDRGLVFRPCLRWCSSGGVMMMTIWAYVNCAMED